MTIKASPTDGLSYSPLDKNYFDPTALAKELERGYDICHGCRLCFNLCPSFPALFDAVDRYDGDVKQLTQKESDYVIDTCYQCKVCYVKCPYTPGDGHEFQLDFPALLQRAKAIRVQQKGLSFRDRMLSNPDLLGKMAGMVPWLANLANKLTPNRLLMHWFAGIHRRKVLPTFAGTSFQSWFNKNIQRYANKGENGKVFLFQTCFVNYNNPEVGKAALEVLSRNKVAVDCDYKQCCGMPALESGDVARAQKMAKENIEHLLPYVKKGYKILAINPTCSMMMRKEYPQLVEGEDAQELASAVMDPNEFLNELRKEGKLDQNFKSTPGTVHYHVPCHLRAQNIGYRSKDMMRSIAKGTEVELVAECCGHDGTWAMKSEYFDLSLKYGKKAFDGMEPGKETCIATDCPLAAIQFKQALGVEPMHPLQVLAKSYKEDGFPTKIEAQTPEDSE